MIRKVTAADVAAITKIYNHYIKHTVITFEEEEISPDEMSERINNVIADGFSWIVATVNEEVIGYAYSCKWRQRSAYRYAVEVSVYLSEGLSSQGWGTKLYEALFADLRRQNIRVAIGGITLPNPASIALHEKFGMTKVAHFSGVGYKFNQWLDVGYWQVQLENQRENL